MINTPVIRPKASETKINTSNDFELAYLRHQYVRRVQYNPTEKDMDPYMAIIINLTRNTYFTYFNLFRGVGMYHDDLVNIGRVHLVSFLGLYALDKQPLKELAWIEKFVEKEKKNPQNKDYNQKNKANFTCFFKQRMEDVVRVCRQKVRNIKGKPSEEFQIFCGKELPSNPYLLLKDYKELGYKKVDFSVFKSIKKKANVENDATIFSFGGNWYVAIAMEQSGLELEDLIGSEYNPYENTHNMQPDTIYEEKEKDGLIDVFNQRSNFRKRVTLQKFIAKNKNVRHYKEEIETARKILTGLGGWIR